MKRHSYEEHFQLNVCPVLFIPLPPSVSSPPSFTHSAFLHLPLLPPYLSPPPFLMCTATQKNNLFQPPTTAPTPVWLCISMPAEHVNLSRSYRRRLVKLSSDSLQQDDHRMPVARRIRTVVTIINGGSNVLLCSHLLYCIQSAASCMAQWLSQREH